jgi:hypothetical protein
MELGDSDPTRLEPLTGQAVKAASALSKLSDRQENKCRISMGGSHADGVGSRFRAMIVHMEQ